MALAFSIISVFSPERRAPSCPDGRRVGKTGAFWLWSREFGDGLNGRAVCGTSEKVRRGEASPVYFAAAGLAHAMLALCRAYLCCHLARGFWRWISCWAACIRHLCDCCSQRCVFILPRRADKCLARERHKAAHQWLALAALAAKGLQVMGALKRDMQSRR